MNKNHSFRPLIFMGILMLSSYGCTKKEVENNNLCEAFDALPENCEIPTVCCPTDGGNCYYVNTDGDDYYCDATADTVGNENGCNAAQEQYIADHCIKMTNPQIATAKANLSSFTKELIEKARLYSVCNEQ